jgi:hypothetical protein
MCPAAPSFRFPIRRTLTIAGSSMAAALVVLALVLRPPRPKHLRPIDATAAVSSRVPSPEPVVTVPALAAEPDEVAPLGHHHRHTLGRTPSARVVTTRAISSPATPDGVPLERLYEESLSEYHEAQRAKAAALLAHDEEEVQAATQRLEAALARFQFFTRLVRAQK